MPLGLFALALGGFGIGLTEFIIAGILSDLARDLHVSVPQAGALVSGYALAVVVGAIGLTAALTRIRPQRALRGLTVLFIVGNALSALAPNFVVMLLGRIIAAFAHGAFFGIGAVVAAGLVAPERKGAAISVMFGGLTLANVLGVPFGTFLTQLAGWRITFWTISAIGVLSFISISLLIKDNGEQQNSDLRAELRAFTRPQVWFSLALTTLIFGGMFGTFIYTEPMLRNITGYSAAAIPWLLVLFGVGLFVGNIVGGRLVDRRLTATLFGTTALLALTLVGFSFAVHDKVAVAIALALLGGVGFATTPGLQMRVMRFASDAPTVASGANIAAFNLGNALGVFLGGAGISAGLGYVSPAWSGALMAAAGLAVLGLATVTLRRRVARDAGKGNAGQIVTKEREDATA